MAFHAAEGVVIHVIIADVYSDKVITEVIGDDPEGFSLFLEYNSSCKDIIREVLEGLLAVVTDVITVEIQRSDENGELITGTQTLVHVNVDYVFI